MATPAPQTPALERARRTAFLRLMPLLFAAYALAYIDRTNVALARLTMGRDLPGFDASVFGFGAGIFFLGYFLLEVPGSVIVERWSARKWICRIMVTWGLVAALTAFVRTPGQFYAMRFLLGLAEAGFFPGVIVYLTHWFIERDRAKALAWFLVATPVAQMVAPVVSAPLIRLGETEVIGGQVVHHASLGTLAGWQWMFLFWGVPAIVIGLVILFWLPDKPREAKWLSPEERDTLQSALDAERAARATRSKGRLLDGLTHPRVLLLCGVFFLCVTANYGIEFFLPSILQDWYGLSLAHVAWLSALPSLLVIGSQLFVGWNSDRLQERRWHVLGPWLCTAVALALVPLTRGHLWLTVACFMVAAAGLKAYLPAFFALPNLFLAGTAAAGSVGLINSIGNLGGFLGPTLLGRLRDLTGSYQSGLWILAGSVSLAAFCLSRVRADAFRPG
ncbi:MFS transporter [Nibricoccus sp. IMCC34717]|uniref:MFS transporter n=1 Tax=Nibricoccus sp. IMCC34717 TaxID=3034021 RepID=UPI0038508CDE